ncbi:hypothetical protein GYMLUDRAFT_167680 [Collybiopsis luxurians FD-317 M1]|uniref:DUF6533 domain-containing protein n=1 Tax=Collybiopsis luxurians FD-317 M1 TaxID=944289 RepID=A0A0D0BX77_9AGAR|nr:hypothetical protein GYMLUDRAFT_167680 [Collybiopsis luxurians FD-317 M1]
MSSPEESQFLKLYIGNLIPLYVCLVAFTWGLHDYFVTLQDEIKYIWPQKFNFPKFMFFWIRYYTLILLLFDVIQIHVFTIPGVTSDRVCVAMDSVIRVVGALSLWSVEIIMQLRVYALYKCSRRASLLFAYSSSHVLSAIPHQVAMFNFILFLGSIAGFLWVLIHNAQRRQAVIADAIRLPLPGCPTIHTGIEWAQWVPATAYEGILFGFALYKTASTTTAMLRRGDQPSLYSLVLRDNLLYFFGVACLLVFNNLMVVGLTHIPWFSYGPFHAAVGILTTRMLINIRKASSRDVVVSSEPSGYSAGRNNRDSLDGFRMAAPLEKSASSLGEP